MGERERENVSRWWQTVDFRPAPPGWRLAAIFGQRKDIHPIAGWLVQDLYVYDTDTEEIIEPSGPVNKAAGPDRRIVPGICVEGWGWTVDAIDFEGNKENWKVLAPGDPDPSEKEWADEIARRAVSST